MLLLIPWMFALVVVTEGVLPAQARPPQRPASRDGAPTVRAVRTPKPPVLDGLVTEEVWQLAEPATGFRQKDPQEGEPASELTAIRILHDTQHLYVGIVASDSNPDGIRATELRRDDSLRNDDIVEIILDTFHDHRNGYLFRINPLGTQYDATVTNEGQTTNANWDEKWDSVARVTEAGWSAEIAIPFKILRFAAEGQEAAWGINFHRAIKRKNEDVFWTAYQRDFDFEEVSQAGHLEGLSDILGFRLRFKPFVRSGASRAIQRGGEYTTRHLTEVGIEDAKYMITPQLALDLTVNPDFAQADVDEAQVNLTRFSLFFPEKREFFQEGSGIFQFGTGEAFGRPQVLLFHSRRIGLSENREEIPILAGLKLTGKQGPLEVGLLNMQTRRSELASGQSAPGQNFTVLRAKGNILARSYVGAMFTRNTAGLTGASNWTGGLDAGFTFFQNLDLRGFLARSDTPDRLDGEWAGQAKLEWDSDRFEFLAEHLSIQENFRPEMGFVARAEPNWKGAKRNVLEGAYKPRPGIDWIRQFEFSSSLEYIADQEDNLDTRTAELGWSTDFASGDALDFEFSRNLERLVRPLRIRRGATVPRGDYRFDQFRWMYRAFRGRPLSGNMSLELGEFYNGNRTGFDISPQLKLSANLSLDPSYEWNKISLPHTPSFTTQELNTSVNYSFSQRWLTRTTFLVNSQDSQYAINFRLNYIYRPGDDLFVVYNETKTYGQEGRLQNRALIVKFTYSLDR